MGGGAWWSWSACRGGGAVTVGVVAPLTWLRLLSSGNLHHFRNIVVDHADGQHGHPSLRGGGWIKSDSLRARK